MIFSSRLLRTGILVFLLWALPSFAGDTVLVLHSDQAVWKYQEAGNAFEGEWSGPLTRINAADPSLSEEELKRRIESLSPRAVYCIGSRAYLLAGKALVGEPVVLSSAIHWERLPEYRNTLAIENELPPGIQLTHFTHFFPEIKRIGVIGSRRFSRRWIRDAVSAGKEAGFEVVYRFVDRPWQTQRQLEKLLPQVDALWVIPDRVVISGAEQIRGIFRRAHEAHKPVFAYSQSFRDLGATLIVSPDDPTIGRQAAALLRAALKPEGAGHPVQIPAGTEISINLGRIEEYGVTLNEDALESVNHVEY